MIDLHTHSTYSDGVDSLAANLAAARQRGLGLWGASDHVRADTPWLPAYVAEVRRLAWRAPISVRCGVEAKMLDTTGALDLPDDLDGVEYVAIADHRVPTESGPAHPYEVRTAIERGDLTPLDAIEMVVTATRHAAATCPRQPYVAHLFSVLPKIGVTEEDVPDAMLADLGRDLARAGAWVEVNAKWQCPGPRVLQALEDHGALILPGSDAHAASDVGVFVPRTPVTSSRQ